MNNTPIKVIAVGLSEKMKNALQVFFEVACNSDYSLVTDIGEILIADLDNYKERALLDEIRRKYPQIPSVLFSSMSSEENEFSNSIYLKKPLNLKFLKLKLDTLANRISLNELPVSSEALLNEIDSDKKTLPRTLSRLGDRRTNSEEWQYQEQRKTYQTELSSAVTSNMIKLSEADSLDDALQTGKNIDCSYIGSNADINPADIEAVKNISFHQDNFLQGHLYRLSKEVSLKKYQKKNLQLTVENAEFVMSSDGRFIKTNLDETKLRLLSSSAIVWDQSKVTVLEKKWSEIPGTKLKTEETLWKISLWASKGSIPSGTNLKTPVTLRFWPNMTRLLIFPHAIRIAAVWSQRPMSLIDTAIYLDIPQRYVFSFFTATQAIGASFNVEQVAENNKLSNENFENRGLFSKIVNHLQRTPAQEQN